MGVISYRNKKDISILEFLESFYISKSIIYKMRVNNLISINGKVLGFDYVLKHFDFIEIDTTILEVEDIPPFQMELNIVYEDDDLLIVNKPAGILIHSDGNSNETLNNAVSYYFKSKNLDLRVRSCHRLDYDTSGLVVYAKDMLSHAYISHQIESGGFKRFYIAEVSGNINQDEGLIDFKIGKNRHKSNQYLVSKTGKTAITKYRVIRRNKISTIVEIELLTGRRHQIRVHFANLGHPLVGDEIYGKKEGGLMLHARSVSFTHPRTRKLVKFQTYSLERFRMNN